MSLPWQHGYYDWGAEYVEFRTGAGGVGLNEREHAGNVGKGELQRDL